MEQYFTGELMNEAFAYERTSLKQMLTPFAGVVIIQGPCNNGYKYHIHVTNLSTEKTIHDSAWTGNTSYDSKIICLKANA